MDNKNEMPENAESEIRQEELQPIHDPFPKMIVVCFLITIFFLFLIFFFTLVDFANREKQGEIKPKNPAFFEEHLKYSPKPPTK